MKGRKGRASNLHKLLCPTAEMSKTIVPDPLSIVLFSVYRYEPDFPILQVLHILRLHICPNASSPLRKYTPFIFPEATQFLGSKPKAVDDSFWGMEGTHIEAIFLRCLHVVFRSL